VSEQNSARGVADGVNFGIGGELMFVDLDETFGVGFDFGVGKA